MTIEEAIRQQLGEAAAVAAIVHDRIFPGEIPDHETPTPWVFFLLSDEQPGEDLGGNDWQSGSITVEIFAETYAEVNALKIAVRESLNTTLPGGLYRCMWANGSTQPVDGGYNATETYRVRRTSRGVVSAAGVCPVLNGSWILA
jgi:hypothetical protein